MEDNIFTFELCGLLHFKNLKTVLYILISLTLGCTLQSLVSQSHHFYFPVTHKIMFLSSVVSSSLWNILIFYYFISLFNINSLKLQKKYPRLDPKLGEPLQRWLSWSCLEGSTGIDPVWVSELVEVAFQTKRVACVKHIVVKECSVLGKGLEVWCGRNVGSGVRWGEWWTGHNGNLQPGFEGLCVPSYGVELYWHSRAALGVIKGVCGIDIIT